MGRAVPVRVVKRLLWLWSFWWHCPPMQKVARTSVLLDHVVLPLWEPFVVFFTVRSPLCEHVVGSDLQGDHWVKMFLGFACWDLLSLEKRWGKEGVTLRWEDSLRSSEWKEANWVDNVSLFVAVANLFFSFPSSVKSLQHSYDHFTLTGNSLHTITLFECGIET